jgi:hypothetical protein
MTVVATIFLALAFLVGWQGVREFHQGEYRAALRSGFYTVGLIAFAFGLTILVVMGRDDA